MNPLELSTQEDRLWAGLSYAGISCLLVPTLLIFQFKKDESAFIRFHALQAIVYGIILWLWWPLALLMFTLPLFLPVVFLLLGFGLLGYWIVLMVSAFTGKTHQLLIVGEWIQRRSG